MDNSENNKEIFNMSLAILERINLILNNCAIDLFRQDFPSLASSLSALRLQVSYKFSKEEREKDDLFIYNINSLLPEFHSKMFYSKDKQKYFIEDKDGYENYGLLASILEQYQEFLLNCMNRRSMLGSLKDDKRKSVGDM